MKLKKIDTKTEFYSPVSYLIIKTTISSIAIGLKKFYFPLI